MTTEEVITDLFDRVDTKMYTIPKHGQVRLYPSEVVNLALLFAIEGVGTRAFYRWLVRDWSQAFPHLPERIRLFRVVGFGADTAHVHDRMFHPLIEQVKEHLIVLADHHFHAKEGDPCNLNICEQNTWNIQMLVETGLSIYLIRVIRLVSVTSPAVSRYT